LTGTSLVACAMINRNCVVIEKNEMCVRGMFYRMMWLETLPGPSEECGLEGEIEEDEDESEEE
jgi:hypothetical protein